MLEHSVFVRYLLVDFLKAFDVVDHTVLLAKLSQLGLPDRAMNWIISFLIHWTQVVKCDNVISSSQPINASIVQGSGLGPMLCSSLYVLWVASIVDLRVFWQPGSVLFVLNCRDYSLFESNFFFFFFLTFPSLRSKPLKSS